MSLEINLHAKNIQIDDRINDYVIKKTTKLDRYLRGIVEVRVDLSYVKSARDANDRNVAQITLRGGNFLLRAEERTDDIFTAFDSALDKLRRRIEHFKGKRNRRKGMNRADLEEMTFAEYDVELEMPNEIVIRRKNFILNPMNEKEAIEQMNLLGHENFFLFFNAETDAVNVLYRRRHNGYGIIEAQLI